MEKRALVQPEIQLSVRRQCSLVSLHRSNWYYEPEPISTEELALMRTIDKLSTEHPFFGSRNITTDLRQASRSTGSGRSD